MIDSLFQMFDRNGDGYIDTEELQSAFENGYVNYDSGDGDVWSQMLTEVDTDGDGVISRVEFTSMVTDIMDRQGNDPQAIDIDI